MMSGLRMRFVSWCCRRLWKTKPGKVLFINHTGSGYKCNPKYVCEELLRRGYAGELVWMGGLSRTARKEIPARVACASLHGLRALWHLATAEVWVDNVSVLRFLNHGLVKKPGQVYIQTWHGSMGLKLDGLDTKTSDPEAIAALKCETPLVDFCIANSEHEAQFYARNWFGPRKIVKYGHPRNDVFFRDREPLRDKVCRQLGLSPATKLFLYAPTFRDGGTADAELDVRSTVAALEERFGGEWRFLFRPHPKAKGHGLAPGAADVVNVAAYDDIQELLVAADAMATDYSSCICDFLLGGRPGFIFAPDLDAYANGRGLCYPLETTPFPVAKTSSGLADAIRAFDAVRYAEARESFLEARGCVEDGQASARVADLIVAQTLGSR